MHLHARPCGCAGFDYCATDIVCVVFLCVVFVCVQACSNAVPDVFCCLHAALQQADAVCPRRHKPCVSCAVVLNCVLFVVVGSCSLTLWSPGQEKVTMCDFCAVEVTRCGPSPV